MAVWEALRNAKLDAPSALLKINPPPSRFAALHDKRMKERDSQLAKVGLPTIDLGDADLFARDSEIVERVQHFASLSSGHVILDISSLPKRFFFPFVKRLLSNPQIETLVATYTIPVSYAGESLAEDHLPFSHLPLFGPSTFPEKKVDALILSAGFMKLGLSELLDPYKQGVQVNTLLPFPPGLPAFHRNWEFIREIKKTIPALPRPIRIEAYDCSDAFDHIFELTARTRLNTIFAPYGPKPLSLAMCLFSAVTGSIAYYTQPTVYNPDYSQGVKFWDTNLACYGYCIKISGTNLYTIS